jgi:hypothetical protein
MSRPAALFFLASLSVAVVSAQVVPQGELSKSTQIIGLVLPAKFPTHHAGQWVECPPNSLTQGADEFFSSTMFVREHLALTRPPSISLDPEATLRSVNNYKALLATRKCM